MMYCSNCGKELPADSKFCPACGATTPGVVNRPTETVRTTEPVRITEPVRTTEPVRERIVTRSADTGNFTTRRTVNEFYRDAGFWGGLLLIVGFFLPFFTKDSSSLFDAIKVGASGEKLILLWTIFPIAGLFMMLHSLRILPGFLAIFFTFLALIALIYWGYRMITHRADYFGSTDVVTIIKTIGIGLWATVLGTILLLFHSPHTRVEVHHTKVVDRTI